MANRIAPEAFGERLAMLRAQSHQTQAQVAQAVGIQRTTYASYESLGKSPALDVLCRLADYWGVSLDYLTGRTDERHGEPVPDGFPQPSAELVDGYTEAMPVVRSMVDAIYNDMGKTLAACMGDTDQRRTIGDIWTMWTMLSGMCDNIRGALAGGESESQVKAYEETLQSRMYDATADIIRGLVREYKIREL